MAEDDHLVARKLKALNSLMPEDNKKQNNDSCRLQTTINTAKAQFTTTKNLLQRQLTGKKTTVKCAGGNSYFKLYEMSTSQGYNYADRRQIRKEVEKTRRKELLSFPALVDFPS
ncbi:hypothetical protein Tcan_01037, partial [Toxocara canis]